MFNPLALLGAFTPKMMVDGARHWLDSAVREVRAEQPGLKGLARLREAWRAIERRREHRRPEGELPSLGAVTKVERESRGLTVTAARGALRVRVLAADLLQLRAGALPFSEPVSYGVVRGEADWPAAPFELLETAEAVLLKTSALELRIDKRTCELRLVDDTGVIFDAHASAPDARGVRWRGRFDQGAAFYGLGEKASSLNHAGKRFELWNVDPAGYRRGDDPLYLAIPFLVAQHFGRAAGVFFDNPYRAWIDVGATAPGEVDFRALGGELRLYLMAGSPKAVLERYTTLTGRPRLPPTWALGFHQSRYSYFPQARVLEVAKEFRARQLPCDVIHLDIHYMRDYRCFTWHPERFPRPRELTQELHRLGFKALSMIDPGIKVDPGWRVFDEGLKERVFITWPDGEPFSGPVWPGACHFPDFSAKHAREWWGEQYRPLLDDGVDAFWNDMNEIALLTVPPGATVPEAVRHDADGRGASHGELHNQYGLLMARATREGLERLRPNRRAVVLTRSGWAGVQREAMHWTGDNHSTWDDLRLSLQMVLNLGLSGVPLTGPDTGGFSGGPSRELFTRWMQLSAYLPFFRVHSIVGSPDQEPWAFGHEVELLCRAALERRYRLLPYLYTAAWEASQTGAPIARAMAFEFPADARFASLDDQFMLGEALLVAPVLHAGAHEREVVLPEGAWFDFHSGARHEGGQTLKVWTGLEKVPVFLRAGAVVPLWPVQQHVGEKTIDELELVLAAGAGRTSVVYEDDGEHPAPGEAERRVSRYTVALEPFSLTRELEGGYQPAAKRVRLRVYGLPHAVHLSGTGATVTREAWEDGVLVVEAEAPGAFRLGA